MIGLPITLLGEEMKVSTNKETIKLTGYSDIDELLLSSEKLLQESGRLQ